ncbi:MAG: hypothetical protein PVS3B3_30330 [Ktedonobacteraceae bacterium]
MRSDEMIGKIIGHYRIMRPLGIGGTSLVFLAQDIHLQRDVALKLFQPREGETQDFLRRFAREARVVAQLDFPNILPVYDYGEEHDRAYLVMPQMPGGSLRDILRIRRTLPPQETVALLAPILQALQYAHDRGLIHRDIKPGNILFKADGTPMLADFGLVKVTSISTNDATAILSETTSMTGHAIAGTPDYMAPEQITGKSTPISDIYSMGIVLYEMLTGKRPFSADSSMGVLVKQMYERPRSLRELNPQISPALEDVVLRAMEKEAAKRYQRPEDLRQALLQALSPVTYTNDPTATISAWPTVEHSALQKQQNSEPQRWVAGSTPTAQTYDKSRRSLPATPSGEQQLYALSTPVSSLEIMTDGKLTSRRRSSVALLVAGILVALILLSGLGTALLAPQVLGFGHGTRPLTTVAHKQGSKAATTPVTQNVPSTLTTCPAVGTARAATLAPLVLGSQPNLVYIVNEFNPLQGTVKRRQVDANHGIEIVKMPNVTIGEAQVSQDGQWVLFRAMFEKQDQLRMVRVDGQGLQTLYCAPVGSSILSSQWSFNQQSVAFDVSPGGAVPTTYLLNVTSGTVQQELVPQGKMGYLPRTWLDATHIYLTSFFPQTRGTTLQNLYLLDTQKGIAQRDSDLQQVVTSTQYCTNFDTGYDVKSLYLSTCSGDGSVGHGFNGPSSITVQDARGGASRTVFTSATLAITTVRAISQTTLLLMVENTAGDTSKNGLWKINTDGTGLTRLSTDTANTQSLCPFSQYAWSNISLDQNFYALQSYQQDTHTYGMAYGSLNGGDPTQFAGISDGTQLFLTGWTKMT